MKRLICCLLCASGLSWGQEMVLEHVNVIDVKNLQVSKDQSVWIKDQKIAAVVDSKQARKTIPKNITRLDLSGQYVMPGMIDTHVHHATETERHDFPDKTRRYYRHYLRHGITSVRDMAGDARILSTYQRAAMIGNIQAPDIYYSAIIAGPEFFDDPRTISSSKGFASGSVPWIKAITPDTDWNSVAAQAKGTGATAIKIYRKLPPEVLAPMAAAAKQQGLRVWSHTYIEPAMPVDAIRAGVEVLSHADGISGINQQDVEDWLAQQQTATNPASWQDLLDEERIEQALNLMQEKGVYLDATLALFQQIGQGSDQRAPSMQTRYQLARHITQKAHQKGIKITTGTDIQVRNFDIEKPKLYDEMKLLVSDIGMQPIEALQAATYHGALALGIENTHGEVLPGKTANLVVFKQDPTADLKALNSLAHVIKNGRMVYRGLPPKVPFSAARISGQQLWLSGQLGNIPGTKILVADDMPAQMHQTMDNIKQLLQEYDLGFDDLFKCTLMLDDIKDWPQASDIYQQYFYRQLPARSAFATDGLALGAKVELDCIANLR